MEEKQKTVYYARSATKAQCAEDEKAAACDQTIEEQLQECEELAKKNGMHVIKEIRDCPPPEADQPMYQRMLQDWRDGKFDFVITSRE